MSGCDSARTAALVGPVSREELLELFERFRVPSSGRRIVLDALTDTPRRRVGGGKANVVVRYPSRKMGCVVQVESRSVELPFVYRCELASDVRLYVCQPVELRVQIRDAKGRRRSVRYTPDFLVLDSDGFALVECKAVSALERDQARLFPRFARDGTRWRLPAAELAAREHGLDHRVFTSEEVSAVWMRNVALLSDYSGADEPLGAGVERVLERLASRGSVRADELVGLPGVRPQALWWLVANRRVSVDWAACCVFELDTCWVHVDEAALLAHTHTHLRLPSEPASFASLGVCLDAGRTVLWDDAAWKVLARGSDRVTLQCEDGSDRVVALPLEDALKLLRSGALSADGASDASRGAREAAERIVRGASSRELEVAAARQRAIADFERCGAPPAGVSLVSVRRWMRWRREGERLYGSGFVGLLRYRGRKPGTRALEPRQVELLLEAVEAHVNDRQAGTIRAAYAKLVGRCETDGACEPPSLETLRREIKRRSVPDVVRARYGARMAYAVEGPMLAEGASTPPHGARLFEIGEIDHTPLDVRLVSSRTGAVLGSPWLTLLIDAYSRMPLAFRLSFDPPSRASVLGVLWDCVRRHERVPDSVAMDQGAEFQSTDVEVALAALGVAKIESPAGAPRFGAVIERVFGSSNTRFAHELAGNTKLVPLGRRLSPSHRPERTATWTLATLREQCERWFFDVYPSLVHESLGQSPRERFERSLRCAGERVRRHVRCDEALRILLACSARPPIRTVDPGRGLTLSYLRYWHGSFAGGDVSGRSVEVKIDPADCSVVFARVGGQWVTCDLVEARADLAGRSWRQIELAIREYREQYRSAARCRRLNASVLAQLFREVDCAAETELARQIHRDAEQAVTPGQVDSSRIDAAASLQVIDGGRSDGGSRGRAPPSRCAAPIEHEVDFDALEPFDEC